MIIESAKVNKQAWNSALCEAGINGTIFQSTYWADYLKETYGDRPIYITSLDKKGAVQGLLLAMESCYAKYPALTLTGIQGRVIDRIYRSVMFPLHKMLPFIFWEHGPVILSQNTTSSLQKKSLFQEIIEKIMEISERRSCYEIKLARSAFFDGNGDAFCPFGFWKRKMGTIINNIDEPLDLIWSRIDPSAKKNVKKFEGLEIIRISRRNELKEFYDMSLQTSRRAQIKAYPYSYFTSMWDQFSKNDMIAVFIARSGNKPLAGALCLTFNNVIYDFAVADSDYARSMKIYASDALKWYEIKWAREKGMKYHNFGGVQLFKIEAGDAKAQGIYRYKSKWGGKLIEFNDFGKVFPRRRTLLKLTKNFLTDSKVEF